MDNSFAPTVNDLPKMPFFSFLENYDCPTTTLPETAEDFADNWSKYWKLWSSYDNFILYVATLLNCIYYFSKFLLLVVPFVVLVVILFHRYMKHENNNYDKDSKPLTVF
jgi:hypothetical protein